MAWKSMKVTLKGVSPLLMHNGDLADSLNPIVQEISKVTELKAKEKKTIANQERIAELEFTGGLWLDDNQEPAIPAAAVLKMLRDGASKQRSGRTIDTGVQVLQDFFPLAYAGPRSAEKLWGDGLRTTKGPNPFVLRASAVIGKARVMRTRPRFRNWSVAVEVQFDTEMINEKTMREVFQTAGRVVGLGDWRPGSPKGGTFGRFDVQFES